MRRIGDDFGVAAMSLGQVILGPFQAGDLVERLWTFVDLANVGTLLLPGMFANPPSSAAVFRSQGEFWSSTRGCPTPVGALLEMAFWHRVEATHRYFGLLVDNSGVAGAIVGYAWLQVRPRGEQRGHDIPAVPTFYRGL